MFTDIWGRWTHFDEYFSNGLKPRTRSSLKLTVCTLKWLVGRQAFPFGARGLFSGTKLLLVSGRVKLDNGPFLTVGFLVDVFCSLSKESFRVKTILKKKSWKTNISFYQPALLKRMLFPIWWGMFSRSPGGPYRLFKLTGDMVEYSSRLALPFLNKDS